MQENIGATTVKQYKFRKFDGKMNRQIYRKIATQIDRYKHRYDIHIKIDRQTI